MADFRCTTGITANVPGVGLLVRTCRNEMGKESSRGIKQKYLPLLTHRVDAAWARRETEKKKRGPWANGR